MPENELIIYTDGSYFPKSHCGGFGYVITDTRHTFSKKEFRCDFGPMISVAYFEFMGVLTALQNVPSTKLKTFVYTDSKNVLGYLKMDHEAMIENANSKLRRYHRFQRAVSAAKRLQKHVGRFSDIGFYKTRSHTGENLEVHDELQEFIKRRIEEIDNDRKV
ncbi:RNase H family protein [Loigolactobacillus backii]|uniref:RNase H family protein n=1 Tax=Loigolactobacillus backii TaxID=375175 RepID=UPI0007F11632|nr:RNase H family protein [Loigolactobacillus backii]ANK59795.1 hypothetical protein AYR52_05695 [Loigolactobacillus backii]ANK60010.1 hypothetical protein AYR52_06880 [Loigolactobacillus backii]MDA5386547.1 hypothetical protein [Loigolactobacillus backii]MDA5389074.1 hypothetical protein [Loigolactobacillus backii]